MLPVRAGRLDVPGAAPTATTGIFGNNEGRKATARCEPGANPKCPRHRVRQNRELINLVANLAIHRFERLFMIVI